MPGGMFDFVCESIEEAESILLSQMQHFDNGDIAKIARRLISHSERRGEGSAVDFSLTKHEVCAVYWVEANSKTKQKGKPKEKAVKSSKQKIKGANVDLKQTSSSFFQVRSPVGTRSKGPSKLEKKSLSALKKNQKALKKESPSSPLSSSKSPSSSLSSALAEKKKKKNVSTSSLSKSPSSSQSTSLFRAVALEKKKVVSKEVSGSTKAILEEDKKPSASSPSTSLSSLSSAVAGKGLSKEVTSKEKGLSKEVTTKEVTKPSPSSPATSLSIAVSSAVGVKAKVLVKEGVEKSKSSQVAPPMSPSTSPLVSPSTSLTTSLSAAVAGKKKESDSKVVRGSTKALQLSPSTSPSTFVPIRTKTTPSKSAPALYLVKYHKSLHFLCCL